MKSAKIPAAVSFLTNWISGIRRSASYTNDKSIRTARNCPVAGISKHVEVPILCRLSPSFIASPKSRRGKRLPAHPFYSDQSVFLADAELCQKFLVGHRGQSIQINSHPPEWAAVQPIS